MSESYEGTIWSRNCCNFFNVAVIVRPRQPFPDSFLSVFCQLDLKILFWGLVSYQNVSRTLKEWLWYCLEHYFKCDFVIISNRLPGHQGWSHLRPQVVSYTSRFSYFSLKQILTAYKRHEVHTWLVFELFYTTRWRTGNTKSSLMLPPIAWFQHKALSSELFSRAGGWFCPVWAVCWWLQPLTTAP